jgi:hypothetical protein
MAARKVSKSYAQAADAAHAAATQQYCLILCWFIAVCTLLGCSFVSMRAAVACPCLLTPEFAEFAGVVTVAL